MTVLYRIRFNRPQHVAGLLRRHLTAVLVILLCAGMVGAYLKKSKEPYQDSGLVVFNAPPSSAFPNPYTSPSGTLIQVAGITAILLTSPQGNQQILAAGGIGQYSVVLTNSYNLEYPNFSSPTVTVTATAEDPAQASRTFAIVTDAIATDVVGMQARVGVPQTERITTAVIGATGPLSLHGSSKRVFAGLLFLVIVAIFTVAGFLDRHPVKFPRRRRRRQPTLQEEPV